MYNSSNNYIAWWKILSSIIRWSFQLFFLKYTFTVLVNLLYGNIIIIIFSNQVMLITYSPIITRRTPAAISPSTDKLESNLSLEPLLEVEKTSRPKFRDTFPGTREKDSLEVLWGLWGSIRTIPRALDITPLNPSGNVNYKSNEKWCTISDPTMDDWIEE